MHRNLPARRLRCLLWVALFFFILVMGLAALQRKLERKWAQS